ncbi:MAG: YlxR family protein [Mogibacterium sp.]|nr:YlxR family protein [Mogibacterium sp.]
MRRCIGCHESKPQSELLRFTYDTGAFRADTDCRNDGRGIYLCRNQECLEKSFKRKAWNRIARSGVDTEEIRRAYEAALSN